MADKILPHETQPDASIWGVIIILSIAFYATLARWLAEPVAMAVLQ